MIRLLDRILTSDSPCDDFMTNYENDEFRGWINKILPEVEDCKQQKQDNPWHIYDCLTHILKSVENMNLQTKGMNDQKRRLLAYTMFFHDIGKPSCYIRRYAKAYGRQVDSFFNHNVKSAEIAKRTLPQLGFDEREIKVMLQLIFKHDIFMNIRLHDDKNQYHKVLTADLIKEEIADLDKFGDGCELMGDLIKVGRADSLSQNPKMTQDSLALLDKMEEMLHEIVFANNQ